MRGFFSWLVILYTVLFSIRSFATVGPRLIESLSSEQARAIEKSLQQKIIKELKVKHLKNFKVLWDDKINQCIETAPEGHPDAVVGVCTISFSALQLSGVAALVRGVDKNSVTVIQYDQE